MSILTSKPARVLTDKPQDEILKVSSRNRVSGVASSKVDISKQILSLLKSRPMTPTELAGFIGKTREHTSRQFLKPLLDDGKIEKVTGTNNYQLVGGNATAQQIAITDINESTFAQSIFIQNWSKHASTVKMEFSFIKRFKLICLGEVTPDFKIHPDSWQNPQTTENVVVSLRKKLGKKRLPADMRAILRRFLKYGMKLQITESEARTLGIDGAKDNMGAHATASFESGQYDKAKDYFKTKLELIDFLKFGVKFWTFVRPSTLYTIRLDQLDFYDRKIEYLNLNGDKVILSVTVDGEKTISNKALYEMALDANSEKYEILQHIDRACNIKDVLEFKTDEKYPKYIYDDEIVRALEKFVADRTKKGFKYLFWNDSEIEFSLENYDTVVRSVRLKDNGKFKKCFKSIGCKDIIFFTRSNYAMRHVGVQHWLELTDYDYGFVAEMGWEDIATLRTFYGRRSRKSFEKKVAGFF